MSWHFLERWIEKANQHSTLIGKFWITFLIVCRMVIVASVGDRVYSDEQSEFKCNTLQPGCTNVCFNSFSPISHLRFWSFQILLVTTPSVMYVVYSAHVPKKKEKNKRRKKREFELLQQHDARALTNANELDENFNKEWRLGRLQQGHAFSRHSNMDDMESKYRRRRVSVTDSDATNKRNKLLSNGMNPLQYVDERYNKMSTREEEHPKLKATLINYKYESDDDRYFRKNERERIDADAWSLPFKQHQNDNATQLIGDRNFNQDKTRGMWRKPRQNGGSKRTKPISELIAWGPASSDDDYNRKIGKGERSLVEADMYGKGPLLGNGDLIKHGLDGEMVIPTAPPPPEYPGELLYLDIIDFVLANQKFLGNLSDKRQNFRNTDVKNGYKSKSGKEPMRVKIVRHKKKPTFTRHFHLYLLNVFARLCFEVLFLVLQIFLYGFTVPELYKCHRWPCPNTVDCFISRPMEKTIFLYFMFVYSCICVLLNLFEMKYLIWVYLFGSPRIRVERYGQYYGDESQLKSTTSYGLEDYDSGDLTTEEFDSSQLSPTALAEYIKYNQMRGRKFKGSMPSKKWMYDKNYHRKKLGLMLDSEEERDDVEIDIMQEEMANDDLDIEINDSGSVGGGDDGFA